MAGNLSKLSRLAARRLNRLRQWSFAGLLALAAMPAAAAEPAPLRVAASIKPLQSLVAAVMQGAGAPALIVQGEGSAHGYQLRPQDAENLSRAQIIFWDGPQMETFLIKPLQVLSPKAKIIALSAAPGIKLLPLRAGGAFEPHQHDSQHEEIIANSAAGGGKIRGEADMHFWLDPQNAAAAIEDIATVLAQQDSARAALYQANAKAYILRLRQLEQRLNAELAPVRGRPFIVFHDAYQYFERRFAMPAAGSITVNPEQAPGARRLRAIRAKIAELQAVCVFSEPQFEPRLVQVLTDGTKARTGALDPLGSSLAAGPNQYIQLLQNLADNLTACLSKEH